MVMPQVSEAQKPHTIFVRHDCNYCTLFTKHLMGTDLERLFNIVDVERNPVDPRQVHSVPTIVVDHNTVYVGRDAFAWLLSELKRAITPMAYDYSNSGTAVPSSIDGSETCMAPMSSTNFTDPDPIPTTSATAAATTESIEARLTRMKAERGS